MYQVLLTQKPSKKFQYEMVYGVTENEYDRQNKRLVAKGYTLIHRQSVPVMVGKVTKRFG